MEELRFEFDRAKSAANRLKHGIDFVEAQALWDDDRMIELDSMGTEEPRRIAVGLLQDKCWAAIFTFRDSAIRLISVRRAREKEVGLHEGQ